jgi:serine/threonine protein kinase
MHASQDQSVSEETRGRIDEVLSRWEDAISRGESPSIEEFCRDCPEILEEVRRQVAELAALRDTSETSTIVAPSAVLDAMPDLTLSSRFRDLTLVAEGGLGRVMRGTGVEIRRDVAIKFIHRRYRANRDAQRQFLAEAEITSRLDHPGVVPVLGLGQTAEGEWFYAMRLIQGEELDKAIAEFHATRAGRRDAYESPAFRDLLHRLISVCKTISYAHSRGILHLDIKPKNIMLGRYGETIVVDWGCAVYQSRTESFRTVDEPSLLPELSPGPSKHGIGTPAYMSPEQFHQSRPLSPAADIFGLGATLYKLLTSVAPFANSRSRVVDPDETRDEFAPPRRCIRTIPVALEAVCLKAMALRPEDRYATAADLAADLEIYLAGGAVKAIRESLPDRLIRWVRKHLKSAVATFVALAALLAMSILFALWSQKVAKDESNARKAESQARLAEVEARQKESDARRETEQLQNLTLRASATYAAELLAREIESRFTLLQRAAGEAELRTLLLARIADPESEQADSNLQQWLDSLSKSHEHLQASGWFVDDAPGMQLAILPAGAPSKGRNWAHRDYFHGQGEDYPEGQGAAPIRRPYLSVPFVSMNGGLRLAFTVPIWRSNDRDSAPIGVLGMSTMISKFQLVDHAILVDLRWDKHEGRKLRGLVVQHPDWRRSDDSEPALFPPFYRLEQSVIDKVPARADSSRPIAGRWRAASWSLDNFHDSVRPVEPPQRAACVAIRQEVDQSSGGDEPGQVPWFAIIVTEQAVRDLATKPANTVAP